MRVLPFRRSIIAAFVLALSAVACTRVPTQEMSDARQAINSARSAQAATYAPYSMDNAKRLLSHAEQSLKQHQYEMARDDALEARQAAMKARQVAVAIADARAAVEEAKARGSAWSGVAQLVDEAQAAGLEGDESRAWELATEAKRRLQ